MPRETDAADSLGEEGSPQADRQVAENFGMTVKQVREFDPQTLDVTRACKFLGLPLKRFDLLATQPEARSRWVESVARQKKKLIELFPQAGKEMKEMLEAIRKFALRKCLTPDSPALVAGGGQGANKSNARLKSELQKLELRTRLLIGGVALAVIVVGGIVAVLMAVRGLPEQQAAARAGDGSRQVPFSTGAEVTPAPARPTTAPNPPAAQPNLVPATPSDPFHVKSVWIGENPRRVLTVTEREGGRFTAKFEIGDDSEQEVTGTIKDRKVSWLGRDVRLVRGGGISADNIGTIKSDRGGDKIDIGWRDKEGTMRSFTLTALRSKTPTMPKPERELPLGVLTPAQALKGQVAGPVTVQFVVRNAPLTTVERLLFLNSEADYHDDKNFCVILTTKSREGRWKAATAEAFKGQTVRAKGKLSTFKGKLQLVIDDETAITLVK